MPSGLGATELEIASDHLDGGGDAVASYARRDGPPDGPPDPFWAAENAPARSVTARFTSGVATGRSRTPLTALLAAQNGSRTE